MNLTEHFTLQEMTFSSTAERRGIHNEPDSIAAANLTATAMGLEQVRALLGAPLHIDSGYRCPALNKAVGGAWNSAHLRGCAADFTCASFGTPQQIVEAIASSPIAFDQLIQEGTWVHIAFDPNPRREVLTAHFNGQGVTYTKGVSHA